MDVIDQKRQSIKPVFVTGSPRSGTTWVGQMLALSPLLNYVHEPFNPDMASARAMCNAEFKRHFTYICEENDTEYLAPLKKMMEGKYDWRYALLQSRSIRDLKNAIKRGIKINQHRQSGGVPLIKDPIALMSCEWLNRHFDIFTIVMTRHPAAFVASIKRLGWGANPTIWALPQKLLMRDYFEPFEKEIIALQSGNHDVIERASLAWKLHHHVIHHYQTKHNDWKFIRHEDISCNPTSHFEELFTMAGLPFTSEIKRQIEQHSGASNPSSATAKDKPIKLNSRATISNWKTQLTPAEIERIRTLVEDVSQHFYSDIDWTLTSDEE